MILTESHEELIRLIGRSGGIGRAARAIGNPGELPRIALVHKVSRGMRVGR
jgi:hypothetical protein